MSNEPKYELELDQVHIVVWPKYFIIKTRNSLGGWEEVYIPTHQFVRVEVLTLSPLLPTIILIATKTKRYGPYDLGVGGLKTLTNLLGALPK